jgi:flagellar hook-basal body complex protein FliE
MTSSLNPLNMSAILQAYQNTDSGPSTAQSGASDQGDSFSSLLGRALDGAIATGTHADAQTAQAISGHGDLTQVVTAVSQAELALQTTVAVRDRVLQAYQDIMKMPI